MIFNNANTIKIILAQIKHTLKYRKETRIGQKCRGFFAGNCLTDFFHDWYQKRRFK